MEEGKEDEEDEENIASVCGKEVEGVLVNPSLLDKAISAAT